MHQAGSDSMLTI